MPEGIGSAGESRTGEGESNSALWRSIRGFFRGSDQSLRAQIEEAIEEHEGEPGDTTGITGDLKPTERQMLRNLLHFNERDADDVAIPRGEIVAIPAASSFLDVVSAFATHGHSRLPVFGESLDEVIGVIHVKDIFVCLADMVLTGKAPPEDWTQLMRQPLFVPQARSAIDVLADMRAKRTHLAVVIDEYSGTDGIITFEDLVEEIVGDVEDEHDDAPTQLYTQIDAYTWDADARTELEDIAEAVDPRLAEVDEDVDTLGGLAVVLAGEVPPVGRVLTHASGWRLEVTEGDQRRLLRVRLHAPQPQATEAGA